MDEFEKAINDDEFTRAENENALREVLRDCRGEVGYVSTRTIANIILGVLGGEGEVLANEILQLKYKSIVSPDVYPIQEFLVNEAIIAQERYCSEHKVPHFAPSDGVCWKCKLNIYTKISVAKAGSELITGCPHCHISYCD